MIRNLGPDAPSEDPAPSIRRGEQRKDRLPINVAHGCSGRNLMDRCRSRESTSQGVTSSVGMPVRMYVARSHAMDIGYLLDRTSVSQEPQNE